MKKLIVVTAILSVIGISGCSVAEIQRGETKPHISFVSLADDSQDGVGLSENKDIKGSLKIFVWSPKNNAAVIKKDGKGCIQGADVFHNQDGSVDISNDLLKLVKGITIDKNASTSDKLLAIKTVSQIIQLKTSTERTSYLSIGMFGLCQLYSNGNLSEAELTKLVGQLIHESVKIVPKAENSVPVAPTQNSIPAEEPKK